RDAAQPGAHPQHERGHRDGRHRVSAGAGVLLEAEVDRRSRRAQRGAHPRPLRHPLAEAQALAGAETGLARLFPEIDTPALLLDLDQVERNLARYQKTAAAAGLKLRPHAKAHKSRELGEKQMAAGAIGLCCAKLAEAEALAAQGLGDLLIT